MSFPTQTQCFDCSRHNMLWEIQHKETLLLAAEVQSIRAELAQERKRTVNANERERIHLGASMRTIQSIRAALALERKRTASLTIDLKKLEASVKSKSTVVPMLDQRETDPLFDRTLAVVFSYLDWMEPLID